MNKKTLPEINDFWSIGINYRKSDVHARGVFAVQAAAYEELLQRKLPQDVGSFFVLSTCNRTEIYGLSFSAEALASHLCSVTEGGIDQFMERAEQKRGDDAINHLFQVAAGLDSQILGDYEIVGQLKNAVTTAKSFGRINGFVERLFNSSLQSARSIRTHTSLSCGTVSVAFAAAQYAILKGNNEKCDHILIMGTGKMGMTACKNLVAMYPEAHITIINRTEAKAEELSTQLGINYQPWENLAIAIRLATTIIVATNAPEPILSRQDFEENDQKLLIDLSIPNNIDPDVQLYKGLHLTNVDELSKINDATLMMRQAEVPMASSIIQHHHADFMEWYHMRQYVPVLKSVKEKLSALEHDTHCTGKITVQKAINGMAKKMKAGEHRPGCTYIETMHSYLQQSQEN